MNNPNRKRKNLLDMSDRHVRRLVMQDINQSAKVPNEILVNLIPTDSQSVVISNSVEQTHTTTSPTSSILSTSLNSIGNSRTSVLNTPEEEFPDDDFLDILEGNVNVLNPKLSFREKITSWALLENISHSTLNKLLNVLKSHECHTDLPCDARTLLQTPRRTIVKEIESGSYYHFGLKSGLINFLIYNSSMVINFELNIVVSIDGLPLSKSSSSQLWPIFGSIYNSNFVFLIGAYHGTYKKPSNIHSFLNDLVVESKDIIENGVQYNETTYKCALKMIIADAPAKSFILNVKGHTGYNSCTKCLVEGEHQENRICFPDLHSVLRTDESFIAHTDEEFHSGPSPFETIPNFGLVSCVPLEYMHLVCLGVVKKLFILWTSDSLKFRLPYQKILAISQNLENNVKKFVPKEFQRLPRSLTLFKMWKDTEFRQFLLYSGPVVLKSNLSSDIYKNFLTLHTAITILCSKTLHLLYVDYAEQLLNHFVESFEILYGAHRITHNVHGLIHIANDVRAHGALDEYSAFKFENFMQELKKIIRKPNQPLQQIAHRYLENDGKNNYINIQKVLKNKSLIITKKRHNDGPILPELSTPQYKQISYLGYTFIKNNKKNNVCGLNTGDIVVIENFAYYKNELVIVGKYFKTKLDLYSYPCPSSTLGIYSVGDLSEINYWSIKMVTQKIFLFPQPGSLFIAAFPLLHAEHHEIQKL